MVFVLYRTNEPASRLRTQGTEQRPRPVDEAGSAEGCAATQ